VFPGGAEFADVKSIDDLLQVALGLIDNKSLLFLTEEMRKKITVCMMIQGAAALGYQTPYFAWKMLAFSEII
jgi:hypothetical protein